MGSNIDHAPIWLLSGGIFEQLEPKCGVLADHWTSHLRPELLHVFQTSSRKTTSGSLNRPTHLSDPNRYIASSLFHALQTSKETRVCVLDALLVPIRIRSHTMEVRTLDYCVLCCINMANWLPIHVLSERRCSDSLFDFINGC